MEMKARIPVLLALVAAVDMVGCATAQQGRKVDRSRPIEFKDPVGFVQSGERVDRADLANVLSADAKAGPKFKSAEGLSFLGQILGSAGGALVGYTLGDNLIRINPNNTPVPWLFAGIGLGLIGVGLPIGFLADAEARQAVDIYNARFQSSSVRDTMPSLLPWVASVSEKAGGPTTVVGVTGTW